MTDNQIKAEWLVKYGLDFIKNYGPVRRESVKEFLQCTDITYDRLLKSTKKRSRYDNIRANG